MYFSAGFYNSKILTEISFKNLTEFRLRQVFLCNI
jgi:hypothetical protein